MTPPAAAAPAVRARTAVPGRPLTTAPRPRRVSGPVRRKAPATPARRQAEEQSDGLVVGLIEALGRISGHRLLDRLIRGRSWIVLVAFALIGIVTLQLGLLKLNAGIGRSLERSALLQRENAALSIENSELAAGNRVESNAAHLGMQLVAPGALRFLNVPPGGDVAQASAALKAPAHASSAGATEASSSSSGAAASQPSSSGESSSGESSASQTSASTTAAPPSEQSAPSSSTAPAASSEAGSASSAAAPSGGESASGAAGAPVSAPAASPTSQSTPAGGTQAEAGG
jgi:cell division protein FtsL